MLVTAAAAAAGPRGERTIAEDVEELEERELGGVALGWAALVPRLAGGPDFWVRVRLTMIVENEGRVKRDS